MQRLLAEPVARQEQGLGIAVPDRKGELAAEPLDAILAPFLPGMHDHFRVAMGPELVSLGQKFGR